MILLSFWACNTVLIVLICNLVVILGVNLAADDCVYIAWSLLSILKVFDSLTLNTCIIAHHHATLSRVYRSYPSSHPWASYIFIDLSPHCIQFYIYCGMLSIHIDNLVQKLTVSWYLELEPDITKTSVPKEHTAQTQICVVITAIFMVLQLLVLKGPTPNI